MKKGIKTGGLLLALLLMLSVSATAAEPTGNVPGIYDLSVSGTVTLSVLDKQGRAVTASDGFYANAEKFSLTYRSGSNASRYLLMLLSDDSGVPTEENLAGIDQKVVTSRTVTLTIFPKSMTSGTTYYLYAVSNGGASYDMTSPTQVASFTYYSPYYDLAAPALGGAMTGAGETGQLNWSYTGETKQITVTGNVSATYPVLVAGYDKNGTMISLSTIVQSGKSAAPAQNASMIKVFWIDWREGHEGEPNSSNLVFK